MTGNGGRRTEICLTPTAYAQHGVISAVFLHDKQDPANMFLLELGPVIFSGAEGIITFIRSHIQIACTMQSSCGCVAFM